MGPRRPSYSILKVEGFAFSFSFLGRPNLTVGFALGGAFEKRFRPETFTSFFCGISGSYHGLKCKNPTLAAVYLVGPRKPPYSVSEVEGSACSFSSFIFPNLVVGFTLVGPFGKEFRLGIFTFIFRGILGSPHGFKHKNPTLAFA